MLPLEMQENVFLPPGTRLWRYMYTLIYPFNPHNSQELLFIISLGECMSFSTWLPWTGIFVVQFQYLDYMLAYGIKHSCCGFINMLSYLGQNRA